MTYEEFYKKVEYAATHSTGYECLGRSIFAILDEFRLDAAKADETCLNCGHPLNGGACAPCFAPSE